MTYKDPEIHKAKQKEYCLKNREAAVERVRTWRASNPDKVAEQNKRYAEKHPDALRAKVAKYRERHLEKVRANDRKSACDYRASNKEKVKKAKKLWAQSNRCAVNANVARRKSSKLRRTPAWLTAFDKLKIKCTYSIAAMLTRENKEPWHVDHIIPLQGRLVSGLHVPSNLQVLRGVENVSKKNSFEVV